MVGLQRIEEVDEIELDEVELEEDAEGDASENEASEGNVSGDTEQKPEDDDNQE